jgi:hypothetical protein
MSPTIPTLTHCTGRSVAAGLREDDKLLESRWSQPRAGRTRWHDPKHDLEAHWGWRSERPGLCAAKFPTKPAKQWSQCIVNHMWITHHAHPYTNCNHNRSSCLAVEIPWLKLCRFKMEPIKIKPMSHLGMDDLAWVENWIPLCWCVCVCKGIARGYISCRTCVCICSYVPTETQRERETTMIYIYIHILYVTCVCDVVVCIYCG